MASKSLIQNAAQQQAVAPAKSVSAIVNSMLDQEGLRKRFDELLGSRSAQFVSSIVALVNADANLQEAMYKAPMTVIQSALKAATFDLPVDNNLGYAYLVPFKNSHKDANGQWYKQMECSFILGWRGMHQLALRTGAYKTINVTDIREGELKSYNRLTEDIEIEFIEDEERRSNTPIIGYVGYFRLINGTEKTIYMSVPQIQAHEKANRKGEYMGKGWRDNFDAMCRKTVYRQLIGKWGVMSIDYRTASPEAIRLAQQAAGIVDGDNNDAPDFLPDVEIDADEPATIKPATIKEEEKK